MRYLGTTPGCALGIGRRPTEPDRGVKTLQKCGASFLWEFLVSQVQVRNLGKVGPYGILFTDAEAKGRQIRNCPTDSEVRAILVNAMADVGADPALVYAFQKTGVYVCDENEKMKSGCRWRR